MGKGLKFLGVPLLVFALLLLAGTSWARVVDFRAGVSSTTVQSGGKVYVVIELLNEDGQVDPFGYQEVNDLKVQTASLLGKINPTSDADISVNATHKGVVLVEIDYSGVAPGTDLIAVTVKEQVYDEDGDEIWRVIGTKRFNVEVQRPENTAKSVKVTSIALPETPIEDEATSGYTDGKCTPGTCVVEAGRSFIINLQACEEEPNSTSCTLVNSQNSEVKVWLVGTANTVEGNKALGTRYEFTGQFVGGVASITVPAGKITKAGEYKIYVSAPSVYENKITGKNEATEFGNYKVQISPREAKKVVVKALDVDQFDKPWCYANATDSDDNLTSTVKVYLADEYGNVADTTTGLEDSENTTTVQIKYDDKELAKVELGQKNYVSATVNLDCDAADFTVDAGDMEDYTFTVSLKKNDKNYELETSSLEVDVYESALVLNGTAFSASAFLGTGAGVINNSDIENLFVNATNSTGSANASMALGDWFNDDEYSMKFEFYNGTTKVNEVQVIVSNATNGTIERGLLQLADISKVMDKVCVTVTSGAYKLPRVCASTSLDIRDKARATEIKIFQLKSERYVKDLFGHDFHELTGDIEIYAKNFANMTVYNGTGLNPYAVKTLTVKATGANGTKYFPAYAALLVDSNGNFVYDNVTVECQKGTVRALGTNATITWSDTTVTEDTCKVKYGNLYEKSFKVKLNWGAGPDHVKIDTPYDYVLTTSKVPVTLSLRKKDGSLYRDDPGNYTILIDNPSLIRVFTDKTLTTEIHHGEEKIDWQNGTAQLFIQTLAASGDVTITVQNAAGTVSGNLTLHIVESKADIPVVVGSVVASPTSLKLAAGAEGKVTVIVKDVTGNVVSGVEVSAASDNDAIASVTPATCETDAQGKCAFTVTAGSVEGTAHLTFTAQAQSATVDVQVSKVAPQPKNAAPEAAMEAKTLADWPFDPAAEITISGADRAMVVVQPMMQVPADMRGKTATLYYYITLPDGTPVTPEVVSLGEATLGETVTFDILTEAADLSSITGEFYIFVGFATQADFSDLVFNYYAVTLAE